MYSLIHLFHASTIHPPPHLPCCICIEPILRLSQSVSLCTCQTLPGQVAAPHLSDLDSWITAVCVCVCERGHTCTHAHTHTHTQAHTHTHHTPYTQQFISNRNSCIRQRTENLCYRTIYHGSNGVKSKAFKEFSISPANRRTPLKCCAPVFSREISSGWSRWWRCL